MTAEKILLFEHLVGNGLDFLTRSIQEFEDAPKYSVIHFYSAVEIFVKARLMTEHWSLIVTKDPDQQNFLSGDFQSVGLEEAANRLDKIAEAGLSVQELEAFRTVRRHRNKMVHFFHEAGSEDESKKAKENLELRKAVAREQLNAWYHLHRLLTISWKGVFEYWAQPIGEIHEKLRKHSAFLQVVFDHEIPDIESQKKEGFVFDVCPSCGFRARKHESCLNQTYFSKCLVCGLVQKCLNTNCPSCGDSLRFSDRGFLTCFSCQKHLDPSDLIELLLKNDAASIPSVDEFSCELANCADCSSYHTVICVSGPEYLCASCFESFDYLKSCDWCRELNTGDMEDSYLAGCDYCTGRLGSKD